MGVGYRLVNQTRNEVVAYLHLPASKANELAGNPVAAAVTTWYMLRCRGDHIAFVSDTQGEWPFSAGSPEDLPGYREVTDRVVAELIEVGIVRDDGNAWSDPGEPGTVYERVLTSIWMENGPA